MLTTVPEDSSEEEEEMSDLKLLLKKRGNKAESKGMGTSRPAVNLPPPLPPPQVSDPALKPIPDLKKKRPIEPEEREVVVPPKAKQQKVGKDHRNKRASSVENREEPPVADITQQVFVAEEWNRKAYVEAQAEAQARSEAERALGSLKDEVSQISDQLKGVTQERDSFHAGLRNAETQAEAQRKLLNETQKNLSTENDLVKELRVELLKAKEAAKEARRDAQLAKEATKAEKKASYQLGVETTEKGLTEQFASIARDYCDMTWGKALDATGVPADSELRLPENIFYDADIRQLPEADAPPPTQLPEVSEQPLVDQAPLVILEPTKDSSQLGDQGPPTEPH
nr:uncharacterized protein LOC112009726 [Quercus suber]